MRSHYVEFSSLFVCFSSAMCVRTLLYAPVPSTQLAFLTFIHEHWFGFIEKWILYLMHGCTVAWAVSEISIKKWSNENYSGENKMEKEKKKRESWLIHASHSLPLPLFSQFLLMMDISNMIYFPSHISHCIGIYITAEWCYCLLLLADAHMHRHAHTHAHTWQEEVSPRGRPIKLSCLLVQQSTMTGRPITSVNHVISIISLHRSYAKTASHMQAYFTLWYIITDTQVQYVPSYIRHTTFSVTQM